MILEFVQPQRELREQITKIWLFEDANGLANHGTLIAPNARPKIIIPVCNDLRTTNNDKTDTCAEGGIYLIGVRDIPVMLSTSDGVTSSIGMELMTANAYKFLRVPMHELTNNVVSFSDLYGKKGSELQRKIMDAQDVTAKQRIVQEFLFREYDSSEHVNDIMPQTIHSIIAMRGMVTSADLERTTGYSRRYLDMLFRNNLGISPKTFATIIRFQYLYRQLTAGISARAASRMHDLYFDQSHFIKEFKRYTGRTPKQLLHLNNDFGRNF